MNRSIPQFSAALASGLIFGLGLSLSGMLNPARVQAFLDVFGHWDPSLAFVLGGAVLIAFIGVRVAKRMEHPVLDDRFHLPTNQKIDAPLIIGSALFGLGWGLGGFCPGPALASLSVTSLTGSAPQVVLFVVAMLIGMMLHDRLWNRRL
ncbi:putative membrane protein YedE/YeeE [Agrobacterium larrymoorei]|uniref:Membrane protein YedE/YeeE n=1 Tax=Agrobacterium larrymoorei TaxID=160699 RepID=A0AAJ2BFY2_9HYPH|nr:YeeE/YedE family protein [Agrobacterium larrymoorei]MDR6103038.1 putative membrane protein YedE/YeeE [Agrobacterium larrymoorei]